MLGLCRYVQASSSCGEQGYSLAVERGFPTTVASVIAEHGFRSCGLWVQSLQVTGSRVQAQSLQHQSLVAPWPMGSCLIRDQTSVPCIVSPVLFSLVARLCLTLCNSMDCSMPGLPVHHQLPEFTQTHAHRVSDVIRPSHPLSSPSPAFNLTQDPGLFQWVSSSHQAAKGLEVDCTVRWILNHWTTREAWGRFFSTMIIKMPYYR